jgi:C-terminal processing protease CtpA/Prc
MLLPNRLLIHSMKLKACILIAVCFTVLSTRPASAQKNDNGLGKYYYFKVWGFLKYNHPTIASGKMDADSVFLSNLPIVDKAKNNAEFNGAILNMLRQLGTIKVWSSKKISSNKILTKNANHAWFISDKFLSKAVEGKLQYIYQNRFADTGHFYYTANNYIPNIPHEKPYAFADSVNIPYAYRMLTLAKMQAAIDYLYPHKYLMDSNWDRDVKEFIPLFTKANSRIDYEMQLLKLSARINDTHTFSFYKQLKNGRKLLGTKYYPPFDYKLINNKQVLVTKILIPGLCGKAGIQAGDIITGFGNYTVEARINQLAKMLSASNRNALLHRLSIYVNNLFFITDTLQSKILYLRNGTAKSTTLQWAGQQDLPVIIDYIKNGSKPECTGTETDYVSPGIVRFKIEDAMRFIDSIPDARFDIEMDSIFSVAAKAKGIIFDMRGYPHWGGFLNYVYKKFGQSKHYYAQYYKLDVTDFGKYELVPDSNFYRPPGIEPGRFLYKGEVVIIVNSQTLSLSEYNTMDLQNIFPQSVTIGEPSAGADGDEKMLMLPGGYEFDFTGNAIFYPDGTYAQRKGVRIDKVVHPRAADLLNDKDTMLQTAIDMINSKN